MTVVRPGRIPCCVIGCRRTASAERYPGCSRIICGKCWSLAPARLRHRVRLIERLARRRGVDLDSLNDWPARGSTAFRLAWLHAEAFERLVRAATDAKVGIG